MRSMIDVLRRLNRKALNNWIADDFSSDTSDATPEQVWRITASGDRMLYFVDALVGERSLDRQWLAIAAIAAAETVLKYIPAIENRPRLALDVARSYVRGDASDDDVIAAADAAHAYYVSLISQPEPDRFVAQKDAAYAAVTAARGSVESESLRRWWAPGVVIYAANSYAHQKLGGGASPDDAARAFKESHARVARAVRRAVPWATVSDAIERLDAAIADLRDGSSLSQPGDIGRVAAEVEARRGILIGLREAANT